jgi:hypothetical protein
MLNDKIAESLGDLIFKVKKVIESIASSIKNELMSLF